MGGWLERLMPGRRRQSPGRSGAGGGEASAREAALCLLSPDGQQRLTFYRRSDGLWDYVLEAFSIEHENSFGYWIPTDRSGLYDSLAEARRDAAMGDAWAAEGEG